jgi:large subunit ribosomal protein L2
MKKYKPTTPSRRNMSTVTYRGVITTNKPHKALTIRLKSHSGRNSRGVITVRHKGGGNKKLYRLVDFKQNKIDVPGKIETIEYDPYRSAFIALVVYKDGERTYVLAPKGLKVGDGIISGDKVPVKTGNRTALKNMAIGTTVFNIELKPGSGGKLARSAGSYAEVQGQEGKYTILKLASKEIRKVLSKNKASFGQASNSDHNLVKIGKAGRSRWMGIRPTVRGSAMNPVDHPYGGGEGRQPRGTKRPKTKWGKVVGGVRTRNKKKWSSKLIIKRRFKKK